jgi:hypothetical protein
MDAGQPNRGTWSASVGSGVKWMQTSPLGELIIGSVDGLQAIDVFSGATLWRTASYAATDSQRAWVLGDRLLLEDQRGRLRMIDARDGSVGEPFESPLRGEWDPSELRQAHLIQTGAGGEGSGPRVIAHYPQRVVMYDAASGAVVGVDVISDDRDFRFLLLGSAAPGGGGGAALDGGQRLVLVNSRVVQTPIADQPGRRAQQWIYRIYVLSQNCKVLSEPLELDEPLNERVHFAMLLDGTLLLSTPSETLAIPLTEP